MSEEDCHRDADTQKITTINVLDNIVDLFKKSEEPIKPIEYTKVHSKINTDIVDIQNETDTIKHLIKIDSDMNRHIIDNHLGIINNTELKTVKKERPTCAPCGPLLTTKIKDNNKFELLLEYKCNDTSEDLFFKEFIKPINGKDIKNKNTDQVTSEKNIVDNKTNYSQENLECLQEVCIGWTPFLRDPKINNIVDVEKCITTFVVAVNEPILANFNNNIEHSEINLKRDLETSVNDDIISISSEECIHIGNSSLYEKDRNGNSDKHEDNNDEINGTKPKTESTEDLRVTNEEQLNDFDTVSLISSESHCSGYRSTDFEFITEEEATIDLLANTKLVNDKCHKNVSKSSKNEFNTKEFKPNVSIYGNKHEYDINKWRNYREPFEIDYSYRQNHVVPMEDDYISLFQGAYSMDMIAFENKSTKRSSMHVQYEEMGFDMRPSEGSVDRLREYDQYKDEAKASADIIRAMYPQENRKRRRY